MQIEPYELMVGWELTYLCNYRCTYCFTSRRQRTHERGEFYSPERVRKAFANIGKRCVIHLSGGEPFLYPNFVQLCENLSQDHYISIDSNLSTANVYRFAEAMHPDRVLSIQGSLHLRQRGDLEEFIKKVQHLHRKGFTVFVSQVMYPPILECFEDVRTYLGRRGVVVEPKAFRGYWRMKRYPAAYSAGERDLFLKYLAESASAVRARPMLEGELLYGDLSFKGQKCRAGKDYVSVGPGGDVRRCHGDPARLGNIFEGSLMLRTEGEVCPARRCPCPYYGLMFSHAGGRITKAGSLRGKLKHMRDTVLAMGRRRDS